MVVVFLDSKHSVGIIGTAFLGPHHKLYTAKHLFDHTFSNIEIYDNYGHHIGEATLNQPYTSPTVTSFQDFIHQDHTILTMDTFDNNSDPETEDTFNNTKELTIANTDQNQVVQIDAPVALMEGASGAPVLNDQNEVIGIISSTNTPEGTNNHITDISHYPQVLHNNHDNNTNVLVPNESHAYISPINTNNNQNTPNNISEENDIVTIPAYPYGRTVVYHGHIVTEKYKNIKITSYTTQVEK